MFAIIIVIIIVTVSSIDIKFIIFIIIISVHMQAIFTRLTIIEISLKIMHYILF